MRANWELQQYFTYVEISDDQPLPLLEHDELNPLLNWIDWDQPLSPLDINLPTDPDIITLLSSSSSPTSPVVLTDQSPNPSVDKILQSWTNTPIQFTDHRTNSRQQSRVNIFLPQLFDSKARSNKTQSEESESNPPSPRRLRSNSTALGTSTQDARASLSRPNHFQRSHQIFKQKRKESLYRHHKSVRRPRYNPCLHYQLTNAFYSWEIVFWDYERQEYSIQNTVLSPQRLVLPLSAIEVQPVEWHWILMHLYLSRKTAHDYSQCNAPRYWLKWMHLFFKM